jgi:DNA-binding transcriptional MerR regulator
MISLLTVTRGTAAAVLCFGLCHPPRAAAGTDQDVVDLKRAIEELRETNRELRARITVLEAEKSKGEQVPASAPAAAAGAAGTDGVAHRPAQESKTAVEQRTDELEQRVKQLEVTKTAQESATRSIIQDALSKAGSKINELVTLGGSIEVITARSNDFAGDRKDSVTLSTADMDFEIKPSEWAVGNLILQYDNGTDLLFPTTNGFDAGVDRVTVDRATVIIGDVQRFPIYVKAGRDAIPFGISTGLHRVDLLTLDNPLTVEAFETRRNEIAIGFALPTPAAAPPPQPQVVPPSQPLVVGPLISSISRSMGYVPYPVRRKPLVPVTFPPEPPPFYGDLVFYDANTVDGVTRHFADSMNGRLGYRTSGHCGRSYGDLRHSSFCPWSFDLSVDYISSVYDSNFLEHEYHTFVGRIGKIPGSAASVKASFGPYLAIGEWNGASRSARFVDDSRRQITMRPSAWQVSVARQFDWNPWLETIGSQGDYISLSYSRSHDLAGATHVIGLATGDVPTRVGFVPEKRLIVTAAEWVLEGVRLGLEYTHNWDYPTAKGGTGRQAEGIALSFMLTW